MRNLLLSIGASAKFVFVIPALIIVWTLLIGGPVQELPFGTQTGLNAFAYVIQQLITVMPWLDVLYNMLIWGIQIYIFLLVVQVFKWILSFYFS